MVQQYSEKVNPFWNNVFQNWMLICDNDTVICNHDILHSSLWFNNQ